MEEQLSTEKPVISIVFGSYKRCRMLKETIKSIRNNKISVPYEIIVIDGGSKDGSIEYLTKQQDIITIVQHNRIKAGDKSIMKHSWGYFMNLAFKMAKGKYILMISDDCLLHPNAVMNGYNLFEKELSSGRKVGAVAFYTSNFPNDTAYMVARTFGDRLNVNNGMYLREALDDVGWLDEDHYRFYCADCDVCLRMYQKGYEVIDSPDSYIEHTMHITTKVRKSNIHEEDFDNYVARWNSIYPDASKESIARWVKKEHTDPAKTYRIILKMMSPRITAVYIREKLRRIFEKT